MNKPETLNKAGLEPKEALKAEPAQDYPNLLRQFGAMKTLINCMSNELSYYHKKDYHLSDGRVSDLQKQLESEKDMNAQLTEELENARSHHRADGWYLIGVKGNSSFPQYWCKKDDKGYWKINSFPKVYMHDVYPDMEIYQQTPGV